MLPSAATSRAARSVARPSHRRLRSGVPRGTTEVVDTEASYNNFIGALSRVVTTKGGWHGSWELTDEHDDLIVLVRRVLQLGYERKTWGAALTLWESTAPRIHDELAIARQAGVPSGLVDGAAAQAKWVASTVEGGAYHEAHDEALAGNRFEQPDLAHAESQFKDAKKKYEQSQWFAEKALPLLGDAGGMAVGAKSGMGKAVTDLVMLPGSIADKLEAAKKLGVVGQTATAIDLVNVVLDAADNSVKVVATAMARVQRARQAALLAKSGLTDAIRLEATGLGASAARFDKIAGTLDKLGSAANVLAIVADGIKLVDALLKSPVDWDAVFDSGMEIGLNAAELALGADGAPILAIAIIVRAEIAILGMVSDQIKWAKRETARGAAADFIGVAAKIARLQASDFIADCELAINGQGAVREIATKKVLQDAPKLAKSLTVLGSHVERHAKDSIGGYPDMVASLGSAAIGLFNSPAPTADPLNVAQQCEVVFAAANALARHVQRAYKE